MGLSPMVISENRKIAEHGGNTHRWHHRVPVPNIKHYTLHIKDVNHHAFLRTTTACSGVEQGVFTLLLNLWAPTET